MIATWLTQHRQACALVLARMWRNRLATLMMLGVMGVTLSLPALLYSMTENLGRLAGELRDEPQFSLFLALDRPDAVIPDIEQRLQRHAAVESFRFVPREDAWQRMQNAFGLGDLTAGLERNPLPDAFIVTVGDDTPRVLEQLRDEAAQWPGVEHVQLDGAWVKRLHALISLGNAAVFVLAGLLGFALVAIIGNTIRLQVMTQRDEIEVSTLIGATDRFIRRPFLYAGTLYGVGGGIAAYLILLLVTHLFNHSVTTLANEYGSDFRMLPLGMEPAMLLVSGAAILGWAGAYWAVSQSLRSIGRQFSDSG